MMESMSLTDSHPSPAPGRIRKSKYMDHRKTVEEPKEDIRDTRNLKQKRVFGTKRSTNVVNKSKIEKKAIGKSQIETTLQQPKSSEEAEAVQKHVDPTDEESTKKDARMEPERTEEKESLEAKTAEKDDAEKIGAIERNGGLKKDEVTEKGEEKPDVENEVKPKKKKKSVGFQEKTDEEVMAPRTPVLLSSSLRQLRRSGTPYHTAKNCSRCRFDKLESSSYWMEQIRLAESVEKHFASVLFFQLAHECNAEPVRSMKTELKRYLSRHGHLGKQKEWIEALRSYGLPVPRDDDKSSGKRVDSKKLSSPEDNSNAVSGSGEKKASTTA